MICMCSESPEVHITSWIESKHMPPVLLDASVLFFFFLCLGVWSRINVCETAGPMLCTHVYVFVFGRTGNALCLIMRVGSVVLDSHFRHLLCLAFWGPRPVPGAPHQATTFCISETHQCLTEILPFSIVWIGQHGRGVHSFGMLLEEQFATISTFLVSNIGQQKRRNPITIGRL